MSAKDIMMIVLFAMAMFYMTSSHSMEMKDDGSVIMTKDESEALVAEMDRMKEKIDNAQEIMQKMLDVIQKRRDMECI